MGGGGAAWAAGGGRLGRGGRRGGTGASTGGGGEGGARSHRARAQQSACTGLVRPDQHGSMRILLTRRNPHLQATKGWTFYSRGILRSSTCGSDIDHAVLLVGYGEEVDSKTNATQPYWTIKVSSRDAPKAVWPSLTCPPPITELLGKLVG